MILLQLHKVGLLLGLLFLMHGVWAQVPVNHAEDWFYIETGTDVHIKGSLSSLENNNFALTNLGGMYVSDSINCYGNNKIFGNFPDTITANVFCNGDTTQIFGGDQVMRFGNLFIQNSYDSLRSINDIEILNFIQLDSGNVRIETSTMDLMNVGELIGENNSKRIYTNEYGQIMFSRPLLNGFTYSNTAGIGFGLTVNGNLGTNVDVFRRNISQISVANESVERFYYFTPQFNGFVSNPNIHYLDTIELHGNDENLLSMYRSQTDGLTWTPVETSVNITTDIGTDASGISFPLTTQTMLTLANEGCIDPPVINFAVDTIALCNGEAAWLAPDGLAAYASFWSTGQTNEDSIQVTTTGTYSVTALDLAGCQSEDSVVVIVSPKPVTAFNVPDVCLGEVSNFTNASTISSGTMNYLWNFNDLFTGTLDTTSAVNPSFTFSNQGTYNVSLFAVSDLGCTHDTVISTTVNAIPSTDFQTINQCEDSLVLFTNTTLINPPVPLTYSWDFGNGDNSGDFEPIYGFPASGTFSIELTATTPLGCSSISNETIDIHPNPEADFTVNDVCLGETTFLTNTSTISSGLMSYQWDFGQGAPSYDLNPSTVYSNGGTYQVNLSVISNNGCFDDTTIAVEVHNIPIPTWTSLSSCNGDPVQFTITNFNPTSSYQWNFGDGNTASAGNTSHLYATAGTWNVTLEETDANGCVGTSTFTIEVYEIPTASFLPVTGCENNALQFMNTSLASATTNYNWTFGDGTTESTLNNPSHTYLSTGSYNVTLIAEDNGCLDTITNAVTIQPQPEVNIGSVISTCGSSYTLDAQNIGSAYSWSDGSNNQTLAVTTNGMYHVTVTNATGCFNSDTVDVILNTEVQPNLGLDGTYCDALTLNSGYPLANYSWSNGATTEEISVSTSGQYWVNVTDQNGCTGTDSITVTIVTSELPTLGPDITACGGQVISLNSNVSNGTYVWSTGATTASIGVTNPGDYWVDYTDANGCVNRDSINVFLDPVPALDLGSDGSYCTSISLDVTQPDAASYEWNDGSSTPTQTITTDGTYWVELTHNTSGCSVRDSLTVTFLPSITVDLGNDTTVCNGQSLTLDAQNVGSTYLWNTGDTTQTIQAGSTTSYFVEVYSLDGCVGSDTINITVQDIILPNLEDQLVICQGEQATLTAQNAGMNYAWLLDGSTLPETTQTITISSGGTYTVLVTDNFGCQGADSILVVQNSSTLTADFVVNTGGAVVGDVIQFVNLSYPAPYSSLWDFDDGNQSIQEDPSHSYAEAGDYDVSLTVDDGVCFQTLVKTVTVDSLSKKIEGFQPLENEIIAYNLYPNPTAGKFTLDFETLQAEQATIQLLDMKGRLLASDSKYGKEFSLEYDLTKVMRGMYFVRIQVGTKSKVIKAIKQ